MPEAMLTQGSMPSFMLQFCGPKVTIGGEAHRGARNDADSTLLFMAGIDGGALKVRGKLMISAGECREHAVECRQMSERAPNLRVRDILIDMARAWERLALETEHNAPATPKHVLRHQFRREL